MEETQTPGPTVRATAIRYGLILSAISVAYFLILSMLGVDLSSGVQKWAMTAVTILFVFLAHKYFKDNGDGFMSYGQGVGIGFIAGAISSVISAIVTFIYVKFIDPAFITAIMAKAEQDMRDKGQSDEAIEKALPYIEMFTTPTMLLVMGIVFGLIGSIIIALIVSIFTKKQNPQPAF